MKKISLLLVGVLALFSCEQEELDNFVESSGVGQVMTRRKCSIDPVYTDHIALWIVFVVCAGVLFDRLCKCICFK